MKSYAIQQSPSSSNNSNSNDNKNVQIIPVETHEGFQRYKVKLNGNFCTFSTILNQLSESKQNQNLVSALNEAISGSYDAVFWECPPIKYSELGKQFEFVILEAKTLSSREIDFEPFSEKIVQARETVISFYNLGRDCYLIVPCPINFESEGVVGVRGGVMGKRSLQYLTHLASFIRGPKLITPVQRAVHRDHVSHLWSTVATSLLRRLKEDEGASLWMSTSGMGVSWLHVRLDRTPKYYNYLPYKNANMVRDESYP